jgi:hypothetical protein
MAWWYQTAQSPTTFLTLHGQGSPTFLASPPGRSLLSSKSSSSFETLYGADIADTAFSKHVGDSYVAVCGSPLPQITQLARFARIA